MGHLSASLNQGCFRAMKETVSGNLQGASPPKLSVLLVNKQRIIMWPEPRQHKATQCNPVGLPGLWWRRDCSPRVSPSDADDWCGDSLTCVSIYLFHLNFCKFLVTSAISQGSWETEERKSDGVKWDAEIKWLKNWHKPGEINYKTVIQNVIKNRVTHIPRPLLKKV